jgi:uncharacterized protein YndB with AHSA1/START domain
MMAADGARQGYLIIADISGYTAYLTGTELDHAQDILTRLIQTIIDCCRTPIELVELEGDAVYVYLPASAAAGHNLLAALEGTYFAFASQRDNIARSAGCTCQACVAVPTLDLKFVVHYGEFRVQRLAGQAKPIGPDVILVHRLLKNHIAETMGLRAYIFFTDAALARLDLDQAALGLRRHSEEYEHLGAAEGAVEDLTERWRAEQEIRRVRLEAATARLGHSVELPAPPAVVWEYLTQPERRTRWEPGLQSVSLDEASARIGVGSEVRCNHGDGNTRYTILDWRPFDYFTVATVLDAPLRPPAIVTAALEPVPSGTRLTWYSGPGSGWRAALGFGLGRGRLEASQRDGGERLRRLLAVEWQPPAEEALEVTPDPAAAAAAALASPTA